MTVTIRAVYEGGVLRPTQPLQLAEGESVDVTIAPRAPAAPQISEEEFVRRVEACRSHGEWKELMDLLPPDDGSYDILKALDENRRLSGERPILPREGDPQ